MATWEDARRSNRQGQPPVPAHNVPQTLIDAFCSAFYTSVLTSVVEITIPIGGATTGTKAPQGHAPKPTVALLNPSPAAHAENYRAAIGAAGSHSHAVGALVRGALDYLVNSGAVAFDDLPSPYGLATEATGNPSNVRLSTPDFEERVRGQLLDSGVFNAGDVAGAGLTTQIIFHIVEELTAALTAGVEATRLTPPLIWAGSPSGSPTTNPTPIKVDGRFE